MAATGQTFFASLATNLDIASANFIGARLLFSNLKAAGAINPLQGYVSVAPANGAGFTLGSASILHGDPNRAMSGLHGALVTLGEHEFWHGIQLFGIAAASNALPRKFAVWQPWFAWGALGLLGIAGENGYLKEVTCSVEYLADILGSAAMTRGRAVGISTCP